MKNNIIPYILEILVTGKCNKRCMYCYNAKLFKCTFNCSLLDTLDEFKSNSCLTKFELFGGEIGMLHRYQFQSLVDKLSEFKHINRIELFTNGLFFRRYNLNTFNNIDKFAWELTMHITSIHDFNILHNMRLYNKFKYNYLVILFNELDVILLEHILNTETRNNIYIKFRFPYFEEKFITHSFFLAWCKLVKNSKLYSIDRDISDEIFNKLVTCNNFSLFKLLLRINNETFITDKVNLCEAQTIKHKLIIEDV